MELAITKSKGQLIKDIIFTPISLLSFFIFSIAFIFGLSLVSQDFKFGILLMYIGMIYIVILFIKILKILRIREKKITWTLRLNNYGLEIIRAYGSIVIPYKGFKKFLEQRNSTKIVISKKFRFKSLYIPKDGIDRERRTKFIEAFKEKVFTPCIEEAALEDKKYIVSFRSSLWKDLERQIAKDYRQVGTIVLILTNLFLGILLIGSEKGYIGGIILLGLALIVILKPVINLVEAMNSGKAITHISLKNNKLEIKNNGIFKIDTSNLRIHRDKKGQTIIRNIRDSKLVFGIYNKEVINGSIDKLFKVIEEESITLDKSILGSISIIFTGIAIISIPASLFFQELAVFICLIAWGISLILALINLFKKNAYKKFALISLSMDLILGIFFGYIL